MYNSIKITLLGLSLILRIETQSKECFDIQDLKYFDHSVLDCFGQLYSSDIHTRYPSFTKVLGEGNYGKVYECDKGANKYKNIPKIVVKEIRYNRAINQQKKIKKIEDEIHTSHLLNKQQNMHAVTFYGCIKDNRRKSFYLFYERMSDSLDLGEGEKCNDSSSKCKFYNSTAVEQLIIVSDILEGLKNMHEHKIYHFDIKPDNIMLVENPLMAKLADFGFAYHANEYTIAPNFEKVYDSKNILLDTGLIDISVEERYTYKKWNYRGSPYYMDPQFENLDSIPSEKFDIYSLGITIIQILCKPGYILMPEVDSNHKPIIDKKYFDKRYQVFKKWLSGFRECSFLSKIQQNEKVRKNFQLTILSMINYNQSD